MRRGGKTVKILLAIVAIILVVASLRATSPITMPLAFAAFLTILVHPLHSWLNHRVPRWLSLTLVMLLLTAIFALAMGVLAFSVDLVAPKVPEYADRLQQMLNSALSWVRQRGVSVEQNPLSQNSFSRLTDEALTWLKSLWSALGLFVLVVALLVLLLLEVGQYRKKIEQGFTAQTSHKVFHVVDTMGDKFRGYLLIRTFTSGLTGILTALWCWILGVEFPFVWGLISFLLNYIPTLGSIIAIVPPTIFALVFQGIGSGLGTLGGLTAIQLALGNLVDPRLQGNSLSISPFVVLVSIVFWGWVWGIPGALLGVPMTVSIVVVCKQFDSLRSIALLLGDPDDPDLQQ